MEAICGDGSIWFRRSAPKPNAHMQGILEKRLKGFEPSTFCMASRRSSQLSYSRAEGDSSPMRTLPSFRRAGDLIATRVLVGIADFMPIEVLSGASAPPASLMGLRARCSLGLNGPEQRRQLFHRLDGLGASWHTKASLLARVDAVRQAIPEAGRSRVPGAWTRKLVFYPTEYWVD
jgi:hypothetical protein